MFQDSSVVNKIMTGVRGEEHCNSDHDDAENNPSLPSLREQRKCIAIAEEISGTVLSDDGEILKVITI